MDFGLLPPRRDLLIFRPASCGAATVLTRIAPFELGYDLRSFECANCGNLDTVKVAHQQLAGGTEIVTPREGPFI